MADKKDKELDDEKALLENDGVDEKELEEAKEDQDPKEEKAQEPRDEEIEEPEEKEEDSAKEPETPDETPEDEAPTTSTVSAADLLDQEEHSSSLDEPNQPQKEHTLDDLASEETTLPTGVAPSRPKSFMDFDDTSDQPSLSSSQIPRSGLYEKRRNPKSGKGKTLLLLLIALLVIGGSVYLLKGKFLSATSQSSPTPTPTEEAQATPTPTPTPSIDRSKYSVRVLNGTPKAGLAASVSAKLTSLGYKADKVGNATNSAFTQTQVRAKVAASSVIDQVVKDLSPDFSAASSSAALKDSDTADIEVILGSK